MSTQGNPKGKEEMKRWGVKPLIQVAFMETTNNNNNKTANSLD